MEEEGNVEVYCRSTSSLSTDTAVVYFSPQLKVSKLYTVCSSDASTRKYPRTASSLRAETRMQTGGGKYQSETFLNNIYKVQIRPKMCCGESFAETQLKLVLFNGGDTKTLKGEKIQD